MITPLELPPTPEERASSERRAKLLKVAAGSGAAAVLVGAAVAAPLLASRGEPQHRVPERAAVVDAAPRDAAPEAGDEDVIVKRGSVTPGGTLLGAIQREGLDATAAREIVDALRTRFDPRRSRPEDSFEIEVDRESGKVQSFVYSVGPTEVYDVVRGRDGRMRGRKRAVEVAVARREVGAIVETSLWDAVERAGLRGTILPPIAEVMASDINFFSDPRRGDTIRVIVDEEQVGGRFHRYRPPEALEYQGAKTGRIRAFRYRDSRERVDYYDESGRSSAKSLLKTPLAFVRISSHYNPRRMHPVLLVERAHRGIDYAAPAGTPIWATAAGRVIVCGRAGPSGNLVEIDHGNGLVSIYAHLQRFARGIKVGSTVQQRSVIGYVGSTGRVTGPHLHFGIKKNGAFVNPQEVALQPGRPLPSREMAAFRARVADLSRKLAAIRIGGRDAPTDAGNE